MLADVTPAPVPDGRKLLRLEVRNAETPIERKPEWIKTRARMGPEYTALQSLVKSEGLHTVCQEAGCPNIFECWEDREATFLIGGDQCTRRCDFCQIDTGKPQPLDRDEPRRVAESVQKMGLRYATITGVARDDLPDGGAWLYAETVRVIHEVNPGTGVENLIPDFNGKPDLLTEVFESRPEVLAHNVETVPRIFKRIRPAFRYDRSLDVLTQARDFGLVTKSNLILGMGETREEVSQALRDLHEAGTELVTITQYLRPSARHHPVERWVKPEEFVELQAEAEEIGFSGVLSGPLVRSSYRAGRLYRQAMDARTASRPPDLSHRQPHPARKARMAKTPEQPKMKRRQQFVETFKMARKGDPRLVWWLLGAFVLGAAVGFGLFWLLPGSGVIGLVSSIVGALMLGLLAALLVFSRRAQAAAYAQIEGRPGAAASALTTLRRGWKSEPAVGFTKQQDVVHRVVGPPGIVLVGEGNPTRLKALLANERRRHERVAAEVPIHEIVVGDERGPGPAAQAGAARQQAQAPGGAGRHDRPAQPPQGDRRRPPRRSRCRRAPCPPA